MAKKASAKKTSSDSAAKKTPAKKSAAKKATSKKAAAAKKEGATKATSSPATSQKDATPAPAKRERAIDGTGTKEIPAKAKAKSPYPAAFLKKQRQQLLDEKDKLLESMQGVQREQLRHHDSGAEASGLGDHLADAGNDSTEHDFALSILTKEQGDLRDIDDALVRIEQGTYGVCEGSGETIPQVRLEYIPAARYTRDFQEELEKSGGAGNRRLGRSARIAGAEDGAIESMEESVDI